MPPYVRAASPEPRALQMERRRGPEAGSIEAEEAARTLTLPPESRPLSMPLSSLLVLHRACRVGMMNHVMDHADPMCVCLCFHV